MTKAQTSDHREATLAELRYFNRELSWLDFNARVLEEARTMTTPILEKVKFLSIFASNLDEFFMVRVAGKKNAVREGLHTFDSPDDMPGKEVLRRIHARTTTLIQQAYETFAGVVRQELHDNDVRIETYCALAPAERESLTEYFMANVLPILTPLAVNPAHPFPFLTNLDLYLLICFETEPGFDGIPPMAFVEIPPILPRLIRVPGETRYRYIFLEDLVSEHLGNLFPGLAIQNIVPVRVTRDIDFSFMENEVVDILQSVQKQVKNREQSEAVRLEIAANAPARIVQVLKAKLKLQDTDIYAIPGPLALTGLLPLHRLPLESLKDPPFNPRLPPRMKSTREIFSLLAEEDLLIHHPYESFYTVIEFLNAAAQDPDVLAIKQTLYRTSGDSPIIDALIRAAENGKQVTAVVELKARFDEKNNIIWARQMERSGVNVVYGFIGLKIHAKTTLVVRREGEQLKRYVHVSTGNYNSATAKLYADLGLFTADPDFGQDISQLFNLLTGFNVFLEESRNLSNRYPSFHKLTVAPLNLRSMLFNLIDDEIENQRRYGNGRIVAKMNALVDRALIEKLYEASQAGVQIQLIVRGICCLRPRIPMLSENIRVFSIIDRFLEHSRIYHFHATGQNRVYLASADWMARNMDRRVEIMFPVENQQARDRILKEILPTFLADNVKSRELMPDGSYLLKDPDKDQPLIRSQFRFIELARSHGIKSIPYDKAIRHDAQNSGLRPVFRSNNRRFLVVRDKKDEPT